MSQLLPKSRLITVSMTVALPITASMDHIEEWVSFEIGARGTMSGDNPLMEYDVEAIAAPSLTDTRKHLHSEAMPNGDGSHTIRKWIDDRPAWGPTGIETAIAAARRENAR